jgi:hypothetical protein
MLCMYVGLFTPGLPKLIALQTPLVAPALLLSFYSLRSCNSRYTQLLKLYSSFFIEHRFYREEKTNLIKNKFKFNLTYVLIARLKALFCTPQSLMTPQYRHK